MHSVLTEIYTRIIKINEMKKHYNEGRVPLLQESAQVNDLLRKREIQNPMHMLQKTETRSLLEPKRYYLLHFVVIIVNTKI